MNKVLALDIGTVRIGVAVSSDDGSIALPLETIHVARTEDPVGDIARLLQSQQIHHVVVGMPYELDGSEGLAAKRTRAFVARLRKQIDGIKIFAQDERFTSQVAENVLMELSTKAQKKKLLVDSMAAALILQTWLDRKNGNNS